MSTFLRLLTFLRPYRRGVWWSGGLAALAMGATVAIPALTGAAINAVDAHDGGRLKLLALLIAGAGIARLGLTVLRRIIAGQVSLGVEYDLRNTLYEHLLSLELGFFDRQQTGQLMSRATVDLSAVRFFLGYGLVLIGQAFLTIVLAAIAMIVIDPGLALISLSTVPFVIWVASRYSRRSRPALQEVQQRIAELTADVEENVGGVRVVKAFAREDL
ncbi:MAG: ATP-binding cassette, subfamily bacterial, partial [Solirubrobacteraceae bacterium]|nr:ATP-binding cassette, subfamily bacterial [Solirubrobacteraceae bacterium]